MSDWLKLHRGILHNPIMKNHKYLAVWIYILCRCNHKDTAIIFNNKKMVVKKGSFIGSIRKISESLSISLSTAKFIIDYLVSENMIEHQPNAKHSLFKVKNWSNFQKIERQLHTNCTPAETDKNEKNEKNEKKTTGEIEPYENSETFKKLMKWFKTMPSVNSPRNLAKWYFQHNPELRIKKALGNSNCISKPQFSKLLEHYKEKEQ